MCGIVYYKSFNHSRVNRRILKQYKRQAHRGQEGFGFYLPQSNQLAHHPAEERIKSLLGRVKDEEVLFHHRNPTSTDNVKNACHPFSTKSVFGDTQFVGVHNGWLTNEHELKADHKQLGIEYVSNQKDGRFNDSEALIYDLGLVIAGMQDEPEAEGAIAFIMVERYKGEAIKLHFGRNSSPLNMKLTDGGLSLSSEGVGDPIKPNMLYSFDYVTGEIAESPMRLKDVYYAAYTPPSAHYYPKVNPHVDEALEGEIVDDFAHYHPTSATSRDPIPDDEAYATAGELLVIEGNYTDAIALAEGRKRRAEHKVANLDDELMESQDAGAAGFVIDQQIEQIRLAEHYKEVCDLLKTWLIEDHTLPTERQITARSANA